MHCAWRNVSASQKHVGYRCKDSVKRLSGVKLLYEKGPLYRTYAWTHFSDSGLIGHSLRGWRHTALASHDMHLHTFANIRAIGHEVGTSLGWPRILRRFSRLLKKLSRLNRLPRNHLNPSSLEGFFVRRYNYTWRYPIQRKKSVHLYPRHPRAHVASSMGT